LHHHRSLCYSIFWKILMSRTKVEQLIGVFNSAIVLVALVRLREFFAIQCHPRRGRKTPGMVSLMRDKLSVMTACRAQG
jgi:hypothetical protein